MTINEIETLFLPTMDQVHEKENDLELLTEYQRRMEKNEYITVNFDRVDIEGNCYKVVGQLMMIMRAEREYSAFQRSNLLTQSICVKIIEIDLIQKIIYVSNHQAREEQKPEIVKEINRRLSNKEEVNLMGRVIKIHKDILKGEERDLGVWLDLCGVGISGYIPIKYWKDTYITKLDVPIGEVITTTVIGKKNKTKHTIFHYQCMYQNEHDSVKEIRKYRKNEIVEFECRECKKSLWIGSLQGTKEVCFGNYDKIPMIPGLTYKGTIHTITKKGYNIKVVQVNI